MTIAYLGSGANILTIVAPELTAYMTNVSDYIGVSMVAKLACGTPTPEKIYNNTDILLTDNVDFYISGTTLYVRPQLFGLTEFKDGIYKFSVKFITSTGYTLISNCFFVDVTYKCKVASMLVDIVEENKLDTTDKISSIAHILHYALVNGSNCGCNCDEMCVVFNELTILLTGVNPQITNDCGC